ncbi:ATP-dependent DNA helicase RecG [Arcicella rosea]|uniref:RNA-binding domain-containing protein n=1 Tax=Arcicella rosea TaxID=502909 RepID=UPI00345D114A
MSIPLNISTILQGKTVESERLEFKKSWNPTAIMRTVGAFANDFENLGSGYIVVGIEEENGMPKRPVYGFPTEDFDKVQKQMLGFCNLIRPAYFPKLSLEEIDGKHVLLIWVNAGSNRPYEVPKDVLSNQKEYAFFIRRFSSTVQANTDERRELINLTANIPFDDRVNHRASIADISSILIQQHLNGINSRLYEESFRISHLELCRQMNLVEGSDEYVLPKNVALMMFNPHPEKFFPATTINLTEFPNGLAGESFIEKNFDGPIQQQLVDVSNYIKNQVIKSKTVKIKGEAIAKSFHNYPFAAIEEALANAVYHKNYEIREPIEIRILPDCLEIISYGGTDPSIRKDDLNNGVIRARRYRNRRIGEYLKELRLTEGKGTGIPTIRKALENNGSQPAYFDTDGVDRRFFIVTIPVHPDFIPLTTVQSNQDKPESNQDVQKSNQDVQKKEVQEYTLQRLDNELFMPEQTIKKSVLIRMLEVLKYCVIAKSKVEILQHISLSKQSKNFHQYLEPMISKGLIERTQPDKPTSKHQKYFTTSKGKSLFINNHNV